MGMAPEDIHVPMSIPTTMTTIMAGIPLEMLWTIPCSISL